MSKDKAVSIWFFLGISLVFNGLVVSAAGIYEWAKPPEQPVVLFEAHAGVWWGVLLCFAGVAYCHFYAPRNPKS